MTCGLLSCVLEAHHYITAIYITIISLPGSGIGKELAEMQWGDVGALPWRS